MKKFLVTLTVLLTQISNAHASSFEEFAEKNITPFTDAIADFIFTPVNIFGAQVPAIILWILGAGIFFTFYFRLIPFWGFKHSIEVICGKNASGDDNGEVSSFQALATALSGTIGLGSIAGVAIAISIGGPGAAFWILVGSVFGMSLKFAEASLAVMYRTFNSDGTISGGPMHYIAHGLTKKRHRKLGQFLSVVFAIVFMGGALTGGNLIQINQSTQQLVTVTGGENSIFAASPWIVGVLVAFVVGLITIGGIKSIAKVTEKIVPFMCFLYIFTGLTVIAVNIHSIPDALMTIVNEAFFPESVVGGIFGTIIIGLRRSVQTNEAGTGSAPIVYATAKTKEPVSQGFVSLIEPFLTGLLCLLTAFIVTVTGTYHSNTAEVAGIEMVSASFEQVAPFFPTILTCVVILFALSTLISWAYYGQKCWNYLFGEGKKRSLTFQLLYCVVVVLGSVLNVKSVIYIVDAMMISTSVPNIIAIYILSPEIKNALKEYCKKYSIALKFNSVWYKEDTAK